MVLEENVSVKALLDPSEMISGDYVWRCYNDFTFQAINDRTILVTCLTVLVCRHASVFPSPAPCLQEDCEAVSRQNGFFSCFSCFLGKQIPQVSVVTHPIVEERIRYSKLKMRAVGCVGLCVFENVIIRIQNDLFDLNCVVACSKYLFGQTENQNFL